MAWSFLTLRSKIPHRFPASKNGPFSQDGTIFSVSQAERHNTLDFFQKSCAKGKLRPPLETPGGERGRDELRNNQVKILSFYNIHKIRVDINAIMGYNDCRKELLLCMLAIC